MKEDSTFMSNIYQDVLHEILIRLPDCKPAIRCSTVCKRWFSVVHNSNFIDAFDRRRGEADNKSMKFTLIAEHLPRYDRLSPTKKTGCLDFLPWPRKARIEAHCGGFLLLSIDYSELCICDPLTWQWRLLPRDPETRVTPATAYGLMLAPDSPEAATIKFKVASAATGYPPDRFWTRVFCSETGQWTNESAPAPGDSRRLGFDKAVAGDRVLYWPEGVLAFGGVVAHDPFGGAAERVGLPVADGGFLVYEAKFGTVRGRLRLSQMTWLDGNRARALKVWELDGRPLRWRLVHDARPKRFPESARVVGFDPDDGNALFLCGGEADFDPADEFLSGNAMAKRAGIFRYEFARDSLEKVGRVGPFFRVFTLAQPSSWPKRIPDFETRKRNRSQAFEVGANTNFPFGPFLL